MFGQGENVAIGWLQGGMLKIIRKKKNDEGIIKIDKQHAIKVPDEVKPRLIRLIRFLPFPPFIRWKWYPFYFADPEHALSLELIFQKENKPHSFRLRDSIEPIIIRKKERINIIEAIPMQIKPNPQPEKDKTTGKFKYGIETMSAENLSTFLEGKQESQLNRTTTDKFNLIMFVAIGIVIGFLIGNMFPIASQVAP